MNLRRNLSLIVSISIVWVAFTSYGLESGRVSRELENGTMVSLEVSGTVMTLTRSYKSFFSGVPYSLRIDLSQNPVEIGCQALSFVNRLFMKTCTAENGHVLWKRISSPNEFRDLKERWRSSIDQLRSIGETFDEATKKKLDNWEASANLYLGVQDSNVSQSAAPVTDRKVPEVLVTSPQNEPSLSGSQDSTSSRSEDARD